MPNIILSENNNLRNDRKIFTKLHCHGQVVRVDKLHFELLMMCHEKVPHNEICEHYGITKADLRRILTTISTLHSDYARTFNSRS